MEDIDNTAEFVKRVARKLLTNSIRETKERMQEISGVAPAFEPELNNEEDFFEQLQLCLTWYSFVITQSLAANQIGVLLAKKTATLPMQNTAQGRAELQRLENEIARLEVLRKLPDEQPH